MIIFEDFEAREGATSVTLLESFKSAFNNFDDKWVPTDREQKIFQAASESHYNENSIETIFFQFGGGWTGIIGLVLTFRTSDKQHWQKLGLSEAKDLAREVSKLPSAQVKKLMDDVGRQRKPCAPEPLAYIDETIPTQPKRKRTGLVLQWDHRWLKKTQLQDMSSKYEQKPGKKQRTSTSLGRSSTSTSTVDHTSPRQHSNGGGGGVSQTPSNDTEMLAPSPAQHSDSGYGSVPQTPNDTEIPTSSPQVVDEQPPTPVLRSDNATLLRYPSAGLQDPFRAYQVQSDAVELMRILACLGEAQIPGEILYRARICPLSFSSSGELVFQPALELSPVLAHDDRIAPAIEHLEHQGFISSVTAPDDGIALHNQDLILNVTPKEGPLARSFEVPSHLRSKIESDDPPALVRQAKVQVSKILCHTFPRHAIMPYFFAGLGRIQLEQAKCILKYYDTILDLMRDFSVQERTRFVEFCLSFSHFAEPEWKFKALTIAVDINGERDPLLSARISLRKRELSRLYPRIVSEDPHPTENFIVRTDAISNAVLGQKMILEVQHLIDHDQLSAAWFKLPEWDAVDPMKTSTVEGHAIAPKDLFKAKICRFSGNFFRAKEFLEPLVGHRFTKIFPYVFSHLVAVNCELGEISAARKILVTESGDERYGTRWYPARQGRFELASAEIDLMEGLWAFKSKDLVKARDSLSSAKAKLKKLQPVYEGSRTISLSNSVNLFSILAGLAMIAHLECEFPGVIEDQLDTALSSWESALCCAENCRSNFGWDPSFTQTMIHYAKSHITHRQRSSTTITHFMAAYTGYIRTGLQTYWTGFGTIFYDIVGDLVDRDGGARLPKRQEGGKGGFPFTIGSTRTTSYV